MKARCKKELRLTSFTFEVDKEYDFEVKEIHLPAKMSQVVLARGFETRHLQYATHIEAYPPHLCGHIPGQSVPEKWPITVFFYDRQYCISKEWRSNISVPGVFGDELYCFEEFFIESNMEDWVKNQRTIGNLPTQEEFWQKVMNNPLPRRFPNETIDNIDVRYHASCGQQKRGGVEWTELTKGEPESHYKGDGKKAVDDEFGLKAIFKNLNEKMLAQIKPKDYNGGIIVMDDGILKLPLPVPEKGMKWAVRWHDTPSGEVLPELKQVPIGEPNTKWCKGYPKYK